MKWFACLLPMFVIGGCASTTDKDHLAEAARAVRKKIGHGAWGLYLRDLRDGETLEIRGETKFPVGRASALFLVSEVLQDVEAGKYSLDDRAGGSTIRELLRDVIRTGNPETRKTLVEKVSKPDSVPAELTPRAYGRRLEQLARGEIVSPEVSGKILKFVGEAGGVLGLSKLKTGRRFVLVLFFPGNDGNSEKHAAEASRILTAYLRGKK